MIVVAVIEATLVIVMYAAAGAHHHHHVTERTVLEMNTMAIVVQDTQQIGTERSETREITVKTKDFSSNAVIPLEVVLIETVAGVMIILMKTETETPG